MTNTSKWFLAVFITRGLVGLIVIGGLAASAASGQSSLPERIANAWIEHETARNMPRTPHDWNEEQGNRLEGMDALWYETANGDYFRFVKRTVDEYLGSGEAVAVGNANGDSAGFDLLGRQLLRLYRVTLDARYYGAAVSLRQQLLPPCRGE